MYAGQATSNLLLSAVISHIPGFAILAFAGSCQVLSALIYRLYEKKYLAFPPAKGV
ncbi:MAG: hypothetical protein IKC46_02910 [Lachnospiraceae bacterium]|nr:hypothetical protein [Lachnospiraceae bacterium]